MKYLILLLIIILSSCTDNTDDFVSNELNGEYLSLDDTVPKVSSTIYTTVFNFNGDCFTIKEDVYALKQEYADGPVSAIYLYTQPYTGQIISKSGESNNEIITFKITRVNLDGAPVLTGYKDYRLYKRDDVYVLISVGLQDNGWVDMVNRGDTTYLRKI